MSDPALFRPEAIDPETAAFNAQLAAKLPNLPSLASQPLEVARTARESGRGVFGPLVLSDMAVDRRIAGGVRLRCFTPETVTGVYLHIHGGGFTLGAAHYNDPALEEMARSAQVAVASIEYRLAPENPYPAGLDDCQTAAEWLLDHALAEFGSTRLLIGGDSAGANLAAATLIRLRDRRGSTGFSAANLTYGVYDLALTPSARNSPDSLVINTDAIRWFHAQYARPERYCEPEISPLYADLHDLPPALFIVGTADPLLDDTLFMHARWIAAGNQAELAIYPGGVHGFTGFDFPAAHQAHKRMHDFLRAAH